MTQRLEDHYTVRAWHSQVQEIVHYAGRPLETPLVKAAVGVLIENPFAGQGFVDDLSSLTEHSALLGTELGRRAALLLGDRKVESYGKGGVAGLDGDQEQVVACVTTVFGNGFRDAIGGGKAWISSVTKTDGEGTTIDIPLAFKDEVYVRDYYDGITFTVPTGPKRDELLICVAVSSGTRPFARVGGMTKEEALAQWA